MKTKREFDAGDLLKVSAYEVPILVLKKHYADDKFIQCFTFNYGMPALKSFSGNFLKEAKVTTHYVNVFEGIEEIFKGFDVKKTIEQDVSGDVFLCLTLQRPNSLSSLFLYEEVFYKGKNLSFFNYGMFPNNKRKEESYTTVREYPKDIRISEFFEKARNCFLSGNSILDMV